MKAALFTIGYEQATPSAVLGAIERAGVRLLVDVRAVAASRRPGFSKRQLAAALDEKGIAYLHLRQLGTPSEGRRAARNGRLDDLFRIYETHLKSAGAQAELDELAAIVGSGQPTCLLCYERDFLRCHRRRLAEIICARTGQDVRHLIPPSF